ncbi:rCG58119, isoform CRA_a [Rattus norvegicus]|uniref:Transmembrane protein 202 n=3 Tax=Rattus norvegicus TaxID=10116 RepID=A6J524_RAT|nr:transmembrane protein 202 [Rattus norvegicus]EDL95697.1 rCG58119, isoform CRA_a [Rattus norvegicus]|eukprot:NP_001103106.1 transmembrane protein 202 [Rattus norvegicus]
MERRKEQAMTFYSPKVNKIKGDLKYQQPTLPTNKQSMSAQKRQQYLSEAYTYTRMFCASLSGFSLLLLICTSPMHWVQFLVTNNGLELNAGLWTLCNHELCWSHILKPPYYLQYSRALFIISVLCELIGLGLFFNSCRPTERIVSSELDLKVSMLSFCSAICLLLCLNLFLAQVEWHTKSAMESELLWTYYLNWSSDFLSVCAGIISFLNYITFQSHPPDGSVSEDLQQKYRLGFGPVPMTLPATAEMSPSKMPFLSGRQEKLRNVKRGKLATTRL